MASQKQIEANRRNAQRSTGPRTANGKRWSSRNALRHGLSAKLHSKEGEEKEIFATVLAALSKGDGDPLSAELQKSLADCYQRLVRVIRYEEAATQEGRIATLAQMGGDLAVDSDQLTNVRLEGLGTEGLLKLHRRMVRRASKLLEGVHEGHFQAPSAGATVRVQRQRHDSSRIGAGSSLVLRYRKAALRELLNSIQCLENHEREKS